MGLVNPDEGEVAIAWPSAPTEAGIGTVTARLSNRSLRWIEEQAGINAAELWAMVFTPPLSTTIVTHVLWAGLEDQRRRTGRPITPYTIDDADRLIDEIGFDLAQNRATILVLLAFKGPLAQISSRATLAGKEDPVGPLKAAATDGTGLTTLPPRSEPASPSAPTKS